MNASITLDHIPDLFSFIIVRKEYFGGYLYNPYLYEPIILNKIGIFVLEHCNGCYMVSDIINLTADKFSYPKDFTKKIVLGALQEFNQYFALKWLGEKLSQPKNNNQTLLVPDNKEVLSAPLEILWDITYKCNLKCKHCLVPTNEQFENELSLHEIKDIIDQLAEMKILYVCFLGGEPLIRKDFIEILEYATQKNIRVSFSTNGILIDDQLLTNMKDVKIFDVQVSLDGLEKIHNKIRGLKTAYQDATKAIKQLIKSGINVSVSMSVNKLNLHEVKPLIKQLVSLKVGSFKAIPFLPVGHGKESSSLMLNYVEMKGFISLLVECQEEFKGQILISTEDTYTWLIKESPTASSPIKDYNITFACSAGVSQLVISPTGLVFPCPFLHDFIAGDLKKETMREIWYNSEILGKFRNINRSRLKGKCKDCNFIPKYCKGGCRAAAYALTGDFYAEDPFCWFEPES